MPAEDISSEIVIKREAAVQGSRRPWRVLLDGQNVGLLPNGGSLDLRTSSGTHTVIVVVPPWGIHSAPIQFNADAGGRIELVTQVAKPGVRTRVVQLASRAAQTSAVEIVIKRKTASRFAGQWQVLLDGQHAGLLPNGGSLDLRASPGSHAVVVVLNSTGMRSAPFRFDADAGGHIELVTQATGWMSMWCSAASAMPGVSTDLAGTVTEEARYEVPLGDDVRLIDNSRSASGTTRVVRLTREWTRTSVVDMARATTTLGSGGINLHVVDLKVAAQRTLSTTYSEGARERETFEEQVTLNVAPRTRCTVVFSWKEIRQRGVVRLTSGGSQVRIPYEVVVGITFDQQQIDDQAQ